MLFRANARDLYVISNPPQTVWGISYNNARLVRDSSLHCVSFRMTTMSFRVHTRNPQPYVQWSGILHFTAFRSEWYDCHSERMWGISAVISNANERSLANIRLVGDSSGLHPSEWQHTTKAALLGRGFFLSTVVEMTTKIPRIIEKRRYLLSHKK